MLNFHLSLLSVDWSSSLSSQCRLIIFCLFSVWKEQSSIAFQCGLNIFSFFSVWTDHLPFFPQCGLIVFHSFLSVDLTSPVLSSVWTDHLSSFLRVDWTEHLPSLSLWTEHLPSLLSVDWSSSVSFQCGLNIVRLFALWTEHLPSLLSMDWTSSRLFSVQTAEHLSFLSRNKLAYHSVWTDHRWSYSVFR